MATRLKLLFQGRQSASALKALIFVGFLGLVKIGNFGVIPILFFLTAGLILYNRPFLKASAHLTSFIVLILAAIFMLHRLDNAVLIAIFLFSAAFLFYIVLGLKNLLLVYRASWQYILGLSLFYFIFLIFFALDKSYFLWKEIGLAAVNFFLFKEFLGLIAQDAKIKGSSRAMKNINLAAAIITLLMAEEFWLINLLPIGFLNSANLALISVFMLIDLTRCSWQDNFPRKTVLADITVFVLTTLLIFGISQWAL